MTSTDNHTKSDTPKLRTDNLELHYIQTKTPAEEEITAEFVDLGKEMLEFTKRKARNGDCIALAAPQFGLQRRIVTCFSAKLDEWTAAGNAVIIDREGDPAEQLITLLTHPGKYIRFDAYARVTVSFDNLLTEKMQELTVSDGEGLMWQVMCALLEGEELDVQFKDFRTFRRSEPKIGPNTKCACGSGKKYKRCCARSSKTSREKETTPLLNKGDLLPPLPTSE